jgi:hypothetical protein
MPYPARLKRIEAGMILRKVRWIVKKGIAPIAAHGSRKRAESWFGDLARLGPPRTPCDGRVQVSTTAIDAEHGFDWRDLDPRARRCRSRAKAGDRESLAGHECRVEAAYERLIIPSGFTAAKRAVATVRTIPLQHGLHRCWWS